MDVRELEERANRIQHTEGWDFSSINTQRDPVPWIYGELVKKFLKGTERVLDLGTGGGERIQQLAPYFNSAIAIDASSDMINTAKVKLPAALEGKIRFQCMDNQDLQFEDGSFDVVLNRHAPIFPKEIVRVLKENGYFITQQVGKRNTENICAALGHSPVDDWPTDIPQDVETLRETFQKFGCYIIAQAEYNVRYWFADVDSLVFWLMKLPLPPDFSIEKYGGRVKELIESYWTEHGFETNEHRRLLIIRRSGTGE